MKRLLGYPTRIGPVFLARLPNGRIAVVAEGEVIDTFATIQQAVDDAAGGHCSTSPSGTDLGSLGLPDDAGDWLPAADLQ